MENVEIEELKKNLVAIGRLLWEKELASALNGNISARVDEQTILLTATRTCLGLLHEKDLLRMNLDGKVLEEGEVSSEKPLHTEIYKHFPDTKAIIHTHTLYTNAYFLENDVFTPRIFESRLWFGELKAVPQNTPTVTEVGPIIDKLRKNNVAILKNHGVVAMGKDLFSCFLLIQSLEETMKTEAMSRLFQPQDTRHKAQETKRKVKGPVPATRSGRKYKLFSQEHMDEIVRLLNHDKMFKELGAKTKMTMSLAIKLEESGKIHSFHFVDGKVLKIGKDEHAEFLITAPETVWRAVFSREIDPFVATTQKKMKLKGDFARLSKWYAPCSRLFELWQQVSIE